MTENTTKILLIWTSDKSHYQQFEPPFTIPDSWEWCKLSACCHIAGRIGFRGYTKEDLVCERNGAITLSPSNIVSDSMQYDTCTYISWAKYHESPEIQVQNNDILLVKTGSSFGKCALVKDLPKEATINPQFVVLKHIMVSPEYLTILLQSPYARKCYETFVLGTAIPTFTQEKLGNLAVPVPPYREQLRIIQKLREIQSGVDSIILNKQELDSCIKQAKSKILDLAMQGKLVPQEPTDEPAADMLRRINPKAKIITDNPHYPQLPDNWVLTTIESVCRYGNSQAIPVSEIDEDEWVLELEDIESYTGKLLQIKGKKDRTISGVRHSFKSGDILFSRLRTYLNKVLLSTKNGFCSTEIFPITPFKCIIPEYLYYWIRSPFFVEYTISCGYGVKMPRLSTSDANIAIVPLPPLEEQKRIVKIIKKFQYDLEEIPNLLS